MKKIGELSNKYEISNRMIRYYEDHGILTSVRSEKNYRLYDESSELRLRQIILLRDLGFSLKETERVFLAASTEELLRILILKKSELKKQVKQIQSLDGIIGNYIQLLVSTRNPLQESLSLALANPPVIMKGSVNVNENLRIIELPKMKVLSFRAVSSTPEDDCWSLVNKFVKEKGMESFRHFGFNNPNPSKDSATYGYEMWLTFDESINTEGAEIKAFGGGMYASLTTYMPNIGSRWNELVNLVRNSKSYDMDVAFDEEGSSHQWLEECTNFKHFVDPDIHFSEKQLDLLLPVRRT